MSTVALVAPPANQRSIRGPLRYQITTSSPQLEAGTKFSIYTRITNPYDVPVKVVSVSTLLPVEFIDVAILERAEQKRKIVELINSVQGQNANGFLDRLVKGNVPAAGTTRMSTQPVSSESDADIVSVSDPFSIRQLIRAANDPEATKKNVLRQLHQALAKNDLDGQSDTELQPGNSINPCFYLEN